MTDIRQSAGITLRRINVVPTAMHWRKEVIRNVFGHDPSRQLMAANRRYYITHLADGTHRAFVASFDGEDTGCGAVCLYDELPSPDNPSGRCAYLMNIYVREPYRNRGIAHHIVRRLIEESLSENCGKIYLETTAEGRTLYRELGFTDMLDMMKLPADKSPDSTTITPSPQ